MADAAGTMRLDRFLWFVRLARTRTAAQGIAEDGHLRIDGRRVDRAHAAVRTGNVLTFAAHGQVRVIRVETLPGRRGPAPEARRCYADLGPELGAELGSSDRSLPDESDRRIGPANVSQHVSRD